MSIRLDDLPPKARAYAKAIIAERERTAVKPKPVPRAPVEPLEQRQMRAWLAANDLPACVFEHQFLPDRKFAFDYAWPDQKVALEQEGYDHRKPDRFASDMEKYNLAAVNGWKLLRAVPKDLHSDSMLQLLKRALA